ncbi:O-antigen ligase family protein [Cryobacterium sp. 1639]|uniref:O-antigen ligase family protein n=1 Tax=Cryobacterium inferilacus TaxID=2866629 RepID=UPI001C732F41|nr:O-antigen ligase family protein [Cryobacterium sp. 1639]MBX0301322.1 O-antigen ligase family protein [Cryobacterium sp. 1639]
MLPASHACAQAVSGDRVSSSDRWHFRLLEALLGGLFVFRIALPGPLELPLSDIAALALIVIAAFRHPRRSLRPISWYVYFCVLLVAYLAVVALVNDIDPVRRLARFAILMVLVGFIASARIDLRSVMIGAGVGLVANTALFYAGLAPDNYGGLLTGFLEDKNRAGLYFAVLPLLLIAFVRPTWAKALILIAGAAGLYLTDSRTSMAAFAGGIIWLVLSTRLGGGLRAVLALAIYLAFSWVEDNLAEIGHYAERAGSDALRSRIDSAALIKVSQAPWYGLGVGEGEVTVAGGRWFFHNSYLVLLVEGGWVMLLAVVALFVVVGFRVGARSPRTFDDVAIEAATVAVLLCATRLGEVFFTLPAFLLLGIALAARVREAPPNGGGYSWPTSAASG